MDSISLLDGCQSCLQKGHESWKFYFSKWEILAKREESIPENDLINDIDYDIPLIKLKTNKNENKSPLSMKNNVRSLRCKKVPKSKTNKRKKTNETKQSGEFSNDNSEEKADNERLEMDLRMVFKDILKGNKNKWEIFSVLSQTFSYQEPTTKGSHSVVLEQHLALASNEVKMDRINVSHTMFSSAVPEGNFASERIFARLGSPKLGSMTRIREYEGWNQDVRIAELQKPVDLKNSLVNPRSPFIRFNLLDYCDFSRNQFFSDMCTPHRTSQVDYESRFIKTCPSKFLSHFNYQSEKNKTLKTLDFEFGAKYTTQDNRRNYECLERSTCLELFSAPNNCQQKNYQNLSLLERTNCVTTPKRKPLERKCFSENNLKRKKRRAGKLSLFDCEEDSSDSDEDIGKSSPVILWESKKRKTEISNKILEESDSDDCESIFDRVHKA